MHDREVKLGEDIRHIKVSESVGLVVLRPVLVRLKHLMVAASFDELQGHIEREKDEFMELAAKYESENALSVYAEIDPLEMSIQTKKLKNKLNEEPS